MYKRAYGAMRRCYIQRNTGISHLNNVHIYTNVWTRHINNLMLADTRPLPTHNKINLVRS